MASIVKLSAGCLSKDADNSGVLKLQTGGADALTIETTQNIVFNGVGGLQVPSGTTAQRPSSPVNGMLRYNTTIPQLEIYVGGNWTAIP